MQNKALHLPGYGTVCIVHYARGGQAVKLVRAGTSRWPRLCGVKNIVFEGIQVNSHTQLLS